MEKACISTEEAIGIKDNGKQICEMARALSGLLLLLATWATSDRIRNMAKELFTTRKEKFMRKSGIMEFWCRILRLKNKMRTNRKLKEGILCLRHRLSSLHRNFRSKNSRVKYRKCRSWYSKIETVSFLSFIFYSF